MLKDLVTNPVVSPASLQALQLHAVDLKKGVDALSEADAKVRAVHIDNLMGAFKPVFDMPATTPPEQIEPIYQRQKAMVLQNPQAYGITDPKQVPPTFPGKEQGAVWMAGMQGMAAQIAQRKEEAQTQEALGKGEQAQAETANLKAQLPKIQEEAAQIGKKPGEDVPYSPEVFAQKKALKTNITMGNMLPEGPALDQVAERFNQTGVLPAGFSRSPATTAAIIKRNAELHPDTNLAANQADFKANEGSLRKLQTNFDQVSAFEGTALRNLDLYIQKAQAIPDLSSRFANVPLRMITGKMVGDANYAAMQAARQTAATETAKVLGSATASGVLSDSQKKDALDVLDGNLPLKATLQVVQTLKQDFANRHQSYQLQIQDIKGRLGGPAATTQPPGNAGVIYARDPQGKLHQAPAGTALPAGWKQENR